MTFPIWRTITIGERSIAELRRDFDREKINFSIYAYAMFRELPDSEREKIDLVKIKIKDLGFKKFPTTRALFTRAKKMKLSLCPAEVGMVLRLDYMNQPMDDWFYIGMKPILGENNILRVFHIARSDEGRWLIAAWAMPTGRWDLEHSIVFRYRSSQ